MRIEPNFWVSDEYISIKGLEFTQEANLIGYIDHDGWFFPPIDGDTMELDLSQPYYAGFLDQYPKQSQELDRQYIYHADDFSDLKGHKWNHLRKNTNTIKALGKTIYRKLSEGEFDTQIERLLENWGGDREVYDSDVLVEFALCGQHRWGLFRAGNELIGINIADFNWMFTNFRYCLDNGEQYVQSLLRLNFYTDPEWFEEHPKLVNDGGDLDQKGISTYKQRLNPRRVAAVWTNK